MSIVMRIYLGIGVMIALVVIVGGVGAYQTNRLAHTFLEYQSTAKTSLVATAITEDLLEARVDSAKYRATKDRKYLDGYDGNDGVFQNIAEILELTPELIDRMEGYPEQAELENIHELLIAFRASSEALAEIKTDRDLYVEQTTVLGRKARLQLFEIMESASREGDLAVTSATSMALSHLLLSRIYVERYLVDYNEADMNRATKEIQVARESMTGLLRQLQNPRHRELVQTAIADLYAFDTAKDAIFQNVRDRHVVFSRMDEIGPETLDRMEITLDAVIERQNSLGAAGETLTQNAIIAVAVFVIAGTFLGGILAFATSRNTASRLIKISEDMGELANGNLDVEIAPSQHKHEIGQMTNAMVVFRDNARKARDLDLAVKANEKRDREAEDANRAREAERERERRATLERERDTERARLQTLEAFQKDMERVLNEAASGNFTNRVSQDIDDASLAGLAGVFNQLLEQTETNINDLVKSIGELSQGNLGVRIQGARQGAFKRMKDDFNAALSTLATTMAEIMDSGQNVSGTSAHLEQSSNDMAKRAEQNAASVEETSAAVEQITDSIRQVVNNAQSADVATRKVRESADKTRMVSDQTESSIHAMAKASAQIHQVVSVIEDIAFQINLLALNAGVEAARAGDAGRGFSVVASEVRALAQRSQAAVQEISKVIDQNTQSVEVGVEQVALSRKALEGIISDVEVASDQISEIARAVEQQSVGIEEVNTAIRSIDMNAQINAASLEEMTAASVSMSKEATTLAKALQQFHGVTQSDEIADGMLASFAGDAQMIESTRSPKTVRIASGHPALTSVEQEF